MQTNFGPGLCWVERIDQTGSGIGPRQLLALQDFSIDVDWTVKDLRGQYQMALAQARSQQAITGKMTFAAVQGRLLSDIAFGVTPVSGQLATAYAEAGTVPATTTYTVTVANALNFVDDLGVISATTGQPFNRVTTPTNSGEYSVNLGTGVYTFSAPDASAAVVLAYLWNQTTTGFQLPLKNQLQGITPTFKLTYANPISPGPPGGGGQSLPLGVRLNACTLTKLSLPYKVDDWLMQEFDFVAMADAAQNVGTISAVQ